MVATVTHLLLLSLTSLTVSAQSKPYRNLYGTEDFNSTISQNFLGTTLGAARFVAENEVFLRSEPYDQAVPKKNAVYDFIVVGAGTAGAAIAARLAELRDLKILLLEAGADETNFMDIPMMAPFLQEFDIINWKYETEPSNKYCTGMKNNRCKWPRGKVMGGSSVLNFMIATRGSAEDYDQWAKMGNEGWAFNDVLKYFKKLENMQIKELRSDNKYHNTQGPVTINYAPFHTPIAEAFVKSGRELGYSQVDYNGKDMMGFSYLQSTTAGGLRMSSNKAYLIGKRRPNLYVSKQSLVTKILFNGKRAVGVRFVKYGIPFTAYAKKEVILSAGAIGSPQILMLSGIGPEDHLKDLKINVVKNAPVGDNLMDHIAYGGLTFRVNQPVTVRTQDITNMSTPYLKDFLMHRAGPLTILGSCEAVAFIDTDNSQKKHGRPNMELLFLGANIYANEVVPNDLGLKNDIRARFKHYEYEYAWGVFPMLLRPKSRGTIRLRSNDIYVKPKIVANYLDHPDDIKILIQGIRAAIKVSKTKSMRRFGSELDKTPLPGCEGYTFDTDDYWLCHIRSITMNIYHYSGTCKMGPENDTTAVVNPRLQVIGVEGLRVGDASIIPNIMSAHTNIPSYMIAEKVADMIKEDWGYPIN